MANEAWDYPADAIGYTTGLAVELNQPNWTLRYGFFQMPRVANSLTADDQIFKWPYDGSAQDGPLLDAWGMVTELERRYSFNAHPGTVRLARLSESRQHGQLSGRGEQSAPARRHHGLGGLSLQIWFRPQPRTGDLQKRRRVLAARLERRTKSRLGVQRRGLHGDRRPQPQGRSVAPRRTTRSAWPACSMAFPNRIRNFSRRAARAF